MKSYIQLTNLADTYYDFWTSDGIDSFHADPENVSAWLKNDDIRTDADASLDDLTDDEIDTIADMIADMVADKMKAYYILRDLDGYGSEYPVCVDREEAERLAREWNNEFDEVWMEASEEEIARYGRYDSGSDTIASTYYKVLSLNTCMTEPKEVWFRTEEEAREAVSDSDTAVYEGPVTTADPDEIERIEKKIAEREETARLIFEKNAALSRGPETMTDAEPEETVSAVVRETVDLFKNH